MLELRNIVKTFPGVVAVDHVSLRFYPGEIHAVLGENGAGKSTLMKIMSGIYSHYAGEVLFHGDVCAFRGYHDALSRGISIVNQEIQVISEASIGENIMLDTLPNYRNRLGAIDWGRLFRDAQKYMAMVGLAVAPAEPIGPLSAAKKQLAQIAKALAADAEVILLDEPTSSITEHEAEILFRLMRELRKRGKVLIYVSHKLEEIMGMCDRVSVIRDGRLVGTERVAEVSRDSIVEMMIGREIRDENLGELAVRRDDVVLAVRNLYKEGKVEDVSFRLHRGEILGLYGLVGAGRTETARLIIGDDRLDRGTVFRNGEPVNIKSAAHALYRHGIGYVTENRKEEGLWLDFDVEANVTLTVWHKIVRALTRYIMRRPQRRIASRTVEQLAIKITGVDQIVGQLSGGNQQKTSLAKWLAADCDILIIDEPTVGVDIGAKESIHRLIWSLAAERGKSIILISSDLPEMVTLARRILVFRERKIVGEVADLTGDRASAERASRRIGSLLV